ncbi:MAG: 5-histidylcysteine sulfoxide synthase [Candidatus Cloacimonetes bacterium]|jgi:5-histidylcysteine sulfoxide synthase/putative 4-mercaptohistidine N1-methyltranferase|nr:5-histidylcysteine sulfoxide synthase [Candidatus Cloacimonadota bacterium]
MSNQLNKTKTLILNRGSGEELRQKIRHYFDQTFTIDEKLYELLADEAAFYLRPDPLRHPLIFYLGHTATFYINKLDIAGLSHQRINPEYESMFAVGVDEMSWDDLNEAHYDWPPVARVMEYRVQVRQLVEELIQSLPAPVGGITWDSPWWAIMMCIEHERIHLETSSVLIRQLPLDKVKPIKIWKPCPHSGTAPENQLLAVQGGRIILGKDFDDPLYGWDLEYGQQISDIQDFEASRYLVSNQEFLGFIEAGGYQKKEYWTPEGWAWKSYQKAEHPRFWLINEQGEYLLRQIAEQIPMPWNHPVEVNYLEAKAFCNWKSKLTAKSIRMPTEAEWQLLRDQNLDTDQPYWDEAPGNINLEYWASACPVDQFSFGQFYDIIGNVWQWTETPISAYPGFKIHPYYDDFSVPTFDTRHNIIKGGSFISTGNEATRFARYAFRRHFYQHAGFRYIHSEAELKFEDNLYEDNPDVITWCDLDWESDFARELIKTIQNMDVELSGEHALNVGCKTGRLSFELAKTYGRVTGLDFTTRIIQMATKMKESCFIRYLQKEEGEITQIKEQSIAAKQLNDFADKVEFWQADASNLPAKFTGYDLVLAVNTLEEAINPAAFLQTIPQRIVAGGLLIIADSYLWKTKNPPAGIRKDGEPYRSITWLNDMLHKDFEQIAEPTEIWQDIRQSRRLYESRLLQITIWKKKD